MIRPLHCQCLYCILIGQDHWILKHYLLIPGDDISSDLDLSGCNINTDNGEDESYTKVIEMFSDIQPDHKLQYEERKIIHINGIELAGFIHSKSV